MTHICTDIETLGTRPGFVVLSAAFVRFSDEASCTLNLSVPDQVALGLEIDPDTHAWWGTQPPETWAAATSNPTPLVQALTYFATWIEWARLEQDATIWCRGFTDTPMLQELYRRAGIPCPWGHWQQESSRTLQKLGGVEQSAFQVLPKHVALNDALGDVRASNAALTVLARAHALPAADRRVTAQIAITNAETAAQLEIKDQTLRGALVDNIAAAFSS
ncbi:3'-5' exonuclease [Bradyrhizobium oligotrophicum S58]